VGFATSSSCASHPAQRLADVFGSGRIHLASVNDVHDYPSLRARWSAVFEHVHLAIHFLSELGAGWKPACMALTS